MVPAQPFAQGPVMARSMYQARLLKSSRSLSGPSPPSGSPSGHPRYSFRKPTVPMRYDATAVVNELFDAFHDQYLPEPQLAGHLALQR